MLKWLTEKDPDEVKDYGIDWTALLAEGETITASTWSCDDTDLTIGAGSIAAGVTSVWLSAGIAGTTYEVVNTIETSRGATFQRTVGLKVKEL